MRHRLKTSDKKDYFWIIPLLIILIPFLLIISVVEFFGSKKRVREAKKYFADNQDKCYFFYSYKKGWGDFIINNVIPVLPKDTEIYNIYQDKDNPLSMIYSVIDICEIPWTEAKLPFIIKLSSPTPKIMTLQKDFNIIKKTPKRDNLIQSDIKNKLDKVICV